MRLNNRHGWWRRRRADVAICAGVSTFCALFFARVLLGHRFIITGDSFYYTYPLRTVAWAMIRQGQLPLWTPLFLSGYPLASVAMLTVGYPLTWGHLFLPGHWAEQLYVLAPFLLSPLMTYAYAREVGRSRLAALLAGLSFGYGGMMCGIIANSGMLTNTMMWTPLVLLFIDRARRRPFAYSLLCATAAYAPAVLAGHGQSYVYAGMLALAYGLFMSLVSVATARRAGAKSWRVWAHWRPFIVAVGALALSAGVAAFQVLETLRAARRSVRSVLTYEIFSEGSFTLREAVLSIGAQLYHYVDTGTYVTPLALVLAIVAIVWAARRRIDDTRIWFWLAVAIVAFVLLLGESTPVNQLVYRLPVINKFRVPSRHTFEWTLALSILAAYGWDAVADYYKRWHAQQQQQGRRLTLIATLLLGATIIVGALWWRAVVQPPQPNPSIYTGLPERAYWLWKLAFTALTLALAWCGFRLAAPRLRAVILVAAIALACFVEANATTACWWAGFLSLPAERFHVVSDATRYLQQFPPEQNRVYTRVAMFSEEFTTAPRLDGQNLTMLYGLQNLAGIEPLILARYSRALGDVGPDSVTPRPGYPANDDLFAARSHVLDLLNTTHVVAYEGPRGLYEEMHTYHDGVALSVGELNLNLPPGAMAQLSGADIPADQIALVTSLANSVSTVQGATVAKLRVHMEDGRTVELSLRAGIETAEWAHERADVRAIIKHQLAPIFDSRAGDAANSYAANRYWARVPFGAPPQRISRIEITNVSPDATLTIWKASLVNSHDSRSQPLGVNARGAAWQLVYDQKQVQIFHNARALPRAWLVTAAEAVDSDEALRRIRGASTHAFDPRRTALLEVRPDELPPLPGGDAPADGVRLVSYEPNRLVFETAAATNTLLVVSEIFYPGWVATVDGRPARIELTDYLLRGVALPAGRHRVEMHYAAPAVRNGAIISALTLCLLAGLAFYARRTAKL
ncbi:MAG: hypothetical protein ACJ74W_20180 [Pyrinomonadaceae bacterium]